MPLCLDERGGDLVPGRRVRAAAAQRRSGLQSVLASPGLHRGQSNGPERAGRGRSPPRPTSGSSTPAGVPAFASRCVAWSSLGGRAPRPRLDSRCRISDGASPRSGVVRVVARSSWPTTAQPAPEVGSRPADGADGGGTDRCSELWAQRTQPPENPQPRIRGDAVDAALGGAGECRGSAPGKSQGDAVTPRGGAARSGCRGLSPWRIPGELWTPGAVRRRGGCRAQPLGNRFCVSAPYFVRR